MYDEYDRFVNEARYIDDESHDFSFRERLEFHRKIRRVKEIMYLLILALLAIIMSYDGCAAQPPRIPAPTIKQTANSLVPSVPKNVHVQAKTASTVKSAEVVTPKLKNDAPPGSYKLHVQATAYWTHDPVDASGHGIAFDGTPAVAYKTCAVDPKVIPLGSKVYVKEFGWLRANDTGNAIKGNIIDIAMPNREMAWKWGRRNITVFVQPPNKKG